MGFFQDHGLLNREIQGFLFYIEDLDSFKQPRVQADAATMGSKNRLNHSGDGVQFIIGLSRAKPEKHTIYLAKNLSTIIQCFNSIFEGSFIAIVYDGIYFCLMQFHPLLISRYEVLVLNKIKWGYPEWGCIFCQEWIHGFCFFCGAPEQEDCSKQQSYNQFFHNVGFKDE